MHSSAFSDRRSLLRVTLLILTAICMSPESAFGQLTSSKNVVILPFIASSSDTSLAADLYENFLLGVRRPRSGAIVIQTKTEDDLTQRDIAGILSKTTSMGSYANRTGTAFLLCGAVKRLHEGKVQVTLALYGTDDNMMLATDSHVFQDADQARTGMPEMAHDNTHPRYFTPSDTPILYSIIVPGAGQLIMGETVHAVASVGLLVAAATLSPTGSPEDPAWRRKQLRKNKTSYIALAWVCNVLDTVVLCRRRLGGVDARLFFSIVESASDDPEGSSRSLFGISLRW